MQHSPAAAARGHALELDGGRWFHGSRVPQFQGLSAIGRRTSAATQLNTHAVLILEVYGGVPQIQSKVSAQAQDLADSGRPRSVSSTAHIVDLSRFPTDVRSWCNCRRLPGAAAGKCPRRRPRATGNSHAGQRRRRNAARFRRRTAARCSPRSPVITNASSRRASSAPPSIVKREPSATPNPTLPRPVAAPYGIDVEQGEWRWCRSRRVRAKRGGGGTDVIAARPTHRH